jgi:uroporphyrin-III C-methyltransferase
VTYTAELDVSGRQVTVVGGSPDALGKISTLLSAGAHVTVVSPEVATSIRDLAERGLVTWLPRHAESEDFLRSALVVAATDSRHTDAEVRTAAALENRLTVSAATEQPTPPATEPTSVPVVPGAAAGVPESAATDSDPTAPAPEHGVGRVILVGGGPGDPGLLTVAGLHAIRIADVIVCDRLAPLAALEEARPDAQIIDVGKIPRGEFTPQERINALLVEHARLGRRVVRFKGGDNFIFGRGGEEWQACTAAGIAVEVIPGVSSAVAAPALAGIPLTHRQLTQGFTVVSGHLPPGDPGSTLDWAALARTNTTLVIMMGVATLGLITAELVRQGLDPTTPAATVSDAGMPSQRSARGTVTTIAQISAEAGLKAPAITVIGAVVGFDPTT